MPPPPSRALRRTLFAKGNLDVRDTLGSLRVNGVLQWNGVNEITRTRQPPCTILLRHETALPFAALLQDRHTIPDEVAIRDLPLGPFTARMQFSRAVLDQADAAIILSLQPDLTVPLVQHKQAGYFLHPYAMQAWSEADRAWLRANFNRKPMPHAAESMTDLAALVERIRSASDVPILVFNVSSFVPGDTMHAYFGSAETLATRIRRFNVALLDLASQLDVSIIDIDRLVAGAGAGLLKQDAIHLSAEGCRRAAAEVVRVLDDYGYLPGAAA